MREKGIGALVPEDVRQVFRRFAPPVSLRAWHLPDHADLSDVCFGGDFEDTGETVLSIEDLFLAVVLVRGRTVSLTLDAAEVAVRHLFKLIKRVAASKDQAHLVARVILLMKLLKLLEDVVDLEGFLVADQEAVHDGAGPGNVRLLKLISCDYLRCQAHYELVLNRVDLPFHRTLVEKRRLEELRENVERLIELLVVHVEMEVRVLLARGRIRITSMLLKEILVVVLLRVLLGPEEEHVLAEVRHPIDLLLRFFLAQRILWVLQTAH